MKAYIRISLLFAIAAGLFSCQPGGMKKTAEQEAEEQKVLPVRITKIARDSITRTLEYTANLTAYKEIHYAPASPGRIDKINVDVGSRVRKGQVLVEMDKTQLSTAMTQLASAEDTYKRIKTLYEQGSMAEQQYEQTKTQYELAQQNVEFLSENVSLTSPINGIVTGKYFENGEMFSGAPNTQAGKAAVISLMQIDPLKVLVSVSQKYYTEVKKGMLVEITSDVIPGEAFDGKITKKHPTINPLTRTFQVEIIIANKDEILRPGMFANIRINIFEEETIMLPSISVLKQAGTNNRHIFVSEDGKARQIRVELGKRLDDHVEVISDEIQEGMDLIIEGQAALIDGSDIKVVN